MKLVIEKKTLEEFAQIERSIFGNNTNFDHIYEAWKDLDNFFAQDMYEKDKVWRWTYFRVYVLLTWKVIGTINDADTFAQIMARQAPMAIILDIDIFKEMLWFFSANKADKTRLASLYFKVRNNFLNSQELLGEYQGKNVQLKDLVLEYADLKRVDNSMRTAEFINKLNQILFPPEAEQYFGLDNKADGVDRLLELVNFFEDIDTVEKLQEVLEVFLNPQVYDEPASLFVTSDEETEADVESMRIQAPSLSEIKSQIEQEFKKDSEGNFEDIESVFRKLEEFTEMYNDPKIADLLYFDEESGEFKWRV
jgi:hypothetical protein